MIMMDTEENVCVDFSLTSTGDKECATNVHYDGNGDCDIKELLNMLDDDQEFQGEINEITVIIY